LGVFAHMKPLLQHTIIFTFFALTVMLFSTMIGCAVIPEWYALLFGLACTIIAIPIHMRAMRTERLYLLSIFLNAAGAGFSVSAYYTVTKTPLDFLQMLAAIGLLLLLTAVFVFLTRNEPKVIKWKFFAVLLAFILPLIAFLVLWNRHGAVLFSFGFFSAISVLCFYSILAWNTHFKGTGGKRAASVAPTEGSILRYASFGSFGLYAAITFVVITILTEGDSVADIFPSDITIKKKKKEN